MAILIGLLIAGRVLMVQRAVLPDSLPAEDFYFAGTQYQLTLQVLRARTSNWHAATSPDRRDEARRDALELAQVLHAKYDALGRAPEAVSRIQHLPGSAPALRAMADLDGEVEELLAAAFASVQGLEAFDARLAAVDRTVSGLVNDLRLAELVSFDGAFQAERRAVRAYQEVGAGLLALLGLAVVLHLYLQRKERDALLKETAARAEAQRTVQMRSALLGMVSHELRTPLQTIMTSCETLLDGTLDPAQRAEAERVARASGLIAAQLGNLGQYALLVSGREEVRKVPVNLGEVLGRVMDAHAEAARQRGLRLVDEAQALRGMVIDSDPIRLEQILHNYVSNAIKYSDSGEVHVRAAWRAGDEGADSARRIAEIAVTDHGPGIPASEQQGIWEPFYRGRSVRKNAKGSGLGLAVVKLLATSAGWDVGVRSAAGSGATFYVQVPADARTGGAMPSTLG